MLQPLKAGRSIVRLGKQSRHGIVYDRLLRLQSGDLIEELLHHLIEALKLLREIVERYRHLGFKLRGLTGRRQDEDEQMGKKFCGEIWG